MSYLDTLKRFELREALSERSPFNPYGPGVKVSWTRAEGTHLTGVIEFLHTDPTGTVWAFITMPSETWTAVNLACVRAA